MFAESKVKTAKAVSASLRSVVRDLFGGWVLACILLYLADNGDHSPIAGPH